MVEKQQTRPLPRLFKLSKWGQLVHKISQNLKMGSCWLVQAGSEWGKDLSVEKGMQKMEAVYQSVSLHYQDTVRSLRRTEVTVFPCLFFTSLFLLLIMKR